VKDERSETGLYPKGGWFEDIKKAAAKELAKK